MRDDEFRKLIPNTYDNTMLALYAKCPRAFYWFSRRLDQKIAPAYFAWGRAFGAGINAWHSLQGKAEFRERLVAMIGSAQEEWDKKPPMENNNDTWANLEALLVKYTAHYGETEPWSMMYGKGEMGFKFPIPEIEAFYAGSIDAPIEWPGYGFMIREDKTTGSYINTTGTDSFLIQWDDSTQVAGYCWAFEQLFNGTPPFGALMNIVSKTPRKEHNLQFSRYLVTPSKWDLARFIHDTKYLILRIEESFKNWEWPLLGRRDPINCAGGTGRSMCIYRRLCHTEMEPWQLEDKYNFSEEYIWRDEWKPWEREGANE
jgi:hypothetical protein